jgi:hypothetical protein
MSSGLANSSLLYSSIVQDSKRKGNIIDIALTNVTPLQRHHFKIRKTNQRPTPLKPSKAKSYNNCCIDSFIVRSVRHQEAWSIHFIEFICTGVSKCDELTMDLLSPLAPAPGTVELLPQLSDVCCQQPCLQVYLIHAIIISVLATTTGDTAMLQPSLTYSNDRFVFSILARAVRRACLAQSLAISVPYEGRSTHHIIRLQTDINKEALARDNGMNLPVQMFPAVAANFIHSFSDLFRLHQRY